MNEQPVDAGNAVKSPERRRRLKTFVVIILVLIVAALSRGVVKSMLHSQPRADAVPAQAPGNSEPGKQPWELNWAPPETHAAISFYECLLKDEPGAMNDAAAQAIAVSCHERNPDETGPAGAKPSHLFGYSSPAACAADNAKATPSNIAAKYVWTACSRLY